MMLSHYYIYIFLIIETHLSYAAEERIVRNGCGNGWDIAGNPNPFGLPQEKCYKFIYSSTLSFNWWQAYAECYKEGAELLVVESEAEARWIKSILNSTETGFHSKDKEALGWFVNVHLQFYSDDGPAWSNGRPADELKGILYDQIIKGNLDTTCYNPSYYSYHACFFLSISDASKWKLDDIECGTALSKVGIICNKKKNPIANNSWVPCSYEESRNAQCPDGWIESPEGLTYSSYCFNFSTTSGNWDWGYRQCKKMGAELVYVENANEAKWIRDKAIEAGDFGYTLNMHRYMYGNSWAFSNGFLFSQTGWTWFWFGNDDSCSIEDCGHFWGTTYNNLNDMPCSAVGFERRYICKKPKCLKQIVDTTDEKHCQNGNFSFFGLQGEHLCKAVCKVVCD